MAATIRKLAAIDIAFHGYRFILAEFVAGVFGPLLLGLLSIVRGHAVWQAALGVYLILLAANYVPLAMYAIVLTRHKSAGDEIAEDLQQPGATSQYFRLSLLLLVPLVIPAMAIVQELRRK